MKTFLQLKTEVRASIWPSGEAENLVSQHDDHFQEAAAEISKWVECEQQNNFNVVEFCNTNFKCGMTIIPAPQGVVRRLSTIANKRFCDPVYYKQVDWPYPEHQARKLFSFPGPLNVGLPTLPLGFMFADKNTDSRCGRSRTGVWAIHKGNIYIFPWIQSNELIVVEWDGIKTKWSDDDPVTEAQDYRKTFKLYAQYCHERDYGSMEKALQFLTRRPGMLDAGLFADALADLMWSCRERTKTRESVDTNEVRVRTKPERDDEAVPAPTAPVVIAQIANISSADANAQAIAALVKSWTPSAIICAGNEASTDYDLSVGRLYSDFVSPYAGAFGAGSTENRFWPAPGQSDWSLNNLQSYQTFFSLPNNERYYDICLGEVHLFVIDGKNIEPDGISETSVQGQWLQAKLALSTARWKVVMVYNSPYCSTALEDTNLRWPFLTWGADMVISGRSKAYERFNKNNLPYIVNGLGGDGPVDTFGTPESDSVTRYNAAFGAGRITATVDYLLYEFVNVSGNIVDSVTLTK